MAPSPRPATHAELDAYRVFAAAASARDQAAARAAVDATPAFASLTFRGSPAPLLLAVRCGWTSLVERLVALGAPLHSAPERPDEHLLVAAATAESPTLFAWLCDRGLTLEAFVSRGWCTGALWQAVVVSADPALAEVARRACSTLPDAQPLLEGVAEAAAARCDALALALLECASQRGAPTASFAPALARSLGSGNTRVAAALVARGARLRPAGFLDAARLWPGALRRGDVALAELILAAGFDIGAWEREHGSLLARWPEAHPRAQPVISRLLRHGLRLDVEAPGCGTPLEVARRSGQVALARFLAGAMARGAAADPRP